MPGILGIVSKLRQREESGRAETMLASMVHTTCHKTGMQAFPSISTTIGWVGLSGDFPNSMPAWNERRDICFIFAGEHFASANVGSSPAATAKLLVKHYEDEGDKCFRRLNGIFSGVLVDLRVGKVHLFNDRYGLSRIYFFESLDALYFSSEAKALLKVIPETRTLDLDSLGEWFSCGCTLQNRSLFKGIFLLPPASVWIWDNLRLRKGKYFDPQEWTEQDELKPDDYFEALKEMFPSIVRRYVGGDQPVSLSLTGGLDSRMIIATKAVPAALDSSHTFGGMYRECADLRLGRKIAQAVGLKHHVLPLANDFFASFRKLAAQTVYLSDGTMDVTGAVELHLNSQVRQIAPIRLTGNYGSEILRGNIAFKPKLGFTEILAPELLSSLQKGSDTYHTERRGSLTSFIAFKQVPWYHHSRWSIERAQLTVRSPYLDNELVALAHRSPKDSSVNRSIAHRYIASQSELLAQIPTDRGVVGDKRSGPVATFLQELMPRAEYMFDYGMPQWLVCLDRVLSPLRLERLFLGRQKLYHFRSWYKDDLASVVRDVILDPKTLSRSYLQASELEKAINSHISGRANHSLEIHKLLTLELLQRELLERN